MRLVIFDIDGTLTQTMKADEECFVRSLAEVCGFGDVDTDWSRYRHATDSGIFHEIHETRTGRPPSPIEISRFRHYFVDLLARVSSEAAFAAVTGGRLCYFPAWLAAWSIELRLLPGHGAIRPGSRWQVSGCATTIILRRRETMRWRETLSSGCPCEGQPSDMADVAPLFTLAMVFGMLARVAASAFRLLELPRMAVPRDCPRRVRFTCSPI